MFHSIILFAPYSGRWIHNLCART